MIGECNFSDTKLCIYFDSEFMKATISKHCFIEHPGLEYGSKFSKKVKVSLI